MAGGVGRSPSPVSGGPLCGLIHPRGQIEGAERSLDQYLRLTCPYLRLTCPRGQIEGAERVRFLTCWLRGSPYRDFATLITQPNTSESGQAGLTPKGLMPRTQPIFLWLVNPYAAGDARYCGTH